jgi:hypothetical protein
MRVPSSQNSAARLGGALGIDRRARPGPRRPTAVSPSASAIARGDVIARTWT